MRIGHSIDIHPFDETKPLILGGILLPGPGLKGHSDADVLLHAVAESILGALALGDLGTHFPDTDERYRNQDSAYFVKEVVSIMQQNDHMISNIDCMILAETPKILPYIHKIRENISNLLLIPIERVSVKATTAEQLGFIGKKEGILATATVLLEEV